MTRLPKLLPLVLSLPFWAQAQSIAGIRTDGSTGPITELRGSLMLIPESLGKLSGANLFHSFQRFHIQSGETARFTVQSAGIANVIGRVTGGEASLLNGNLELKAEQGSPAFFFINPAGLVFGPEARIDVPAGFHVSTAAQLQMADGSQWSSSGGSSFSASAPEAFGFLGDTRAAPIYLLPGAVLAPPRQSPAQLVAGDLDFSAAQLVGTGNLRLAATGSDAVSVPLVGALPGGLGGDIRLGEGSFVFSASIRDYATGPVQLSAANLTVSGNSAITSAVLEGGSGRAGDVDVKLRERLWVTGDSYISVSTDTAAEVGDLRIQAGQVLIDQNGRLNAYTAAGGRSGRILIDARDAVRIQEQGKVWSNAIAAGDASDIEVRAPRITLASNGSVAATTQETGKGGSIRLEASDTLHLATDAHVQAYSLGLGSAGAIILIGNDVVLAPQSNVISQALGVGRVTGGVGIQGVRSLVLDGAKISTFGFQGAASADVLLAGKDITIKGATEITSGSLDGTGSAGTVAVLAEGLLEVLGSARIASNTYTEANGGYILLSGETVHLGQEARVASSAIAAAGNGGQVDVKAQGLLRMDGDSLINTSTSGGGQAGLIRLSARNVELSGGARVVSLATQDDESPMEATGRAGDILLEAEQKLSLSAGAVVDTSAGTATSEGGNLLLAAGAGIELRDSRLSSTSFGSGRAGRIGLVSEGTVQLTGSRISTNAFGAGQAGDIGLAAPSIILSQSQVLSGTGEQSSGAAGTVTLAAAADIVLDLGVISSGTLGRGVGGAVDLRAARFTMENGSRVDAAAGPGSSGQPGAVRVQASERIDLSGGSLISIANQARVAQPAAIQPSTLHLAAPRVVLQDSGITSDSPGNVAASSIEVHAPLSLQLFQSSITTRAVAGNGGGLTLESGGLLQLSRSEIATSVLGSQGNGGDIAVAAQLLWLDNGFVQANSAATGGQGGVVNLGVGALVASGNRVTLGGPVPLPFVQPRLGYNAIQAVAPDGVNGEIVLANPLADLSGSLALLDARLLDTGQLAQSPCERRGGSSFALSGRGGLPQQAVAQPRSGSSVQTLVQGGGCR